MILLDQWLAPDERPLPSEAEQISFIEQAEAEKASAFTIPQEAIDYMAPALTCPMRWSTPARTTPYIRSFPAQPTAL